MRSKLLTLFYFIPFLLLAQPKMEFGVAAGAANHLSDTQGTETFPKGTTAAYGVNMRYFIKPALSLKLSYTSLSLSGDETRMGIEWRDKRAFKYNNQLHEFAGILEYDFRAKKRFVDGRFYKTLSPYAYIGGAIGVVGFDVNYNIQGERNPIIPLVEINRDLKERKKTALALPFGAGLRLDLSKTISMNIETGFRPTLSDYLDGISYSGNSKLKDAYGMVMLGLNYRILPPDADNDGVLDAVDACPKDAGKRALNGCPDVDQDGIADKEDRCPTVFGSESLRGCADIDNDSVADIDDLCPNDFGDRNLKGCPDADKDGFADKDDACPTQSGRLNGCPDSDNDGLSDKDDDCPTAAGSKKFNGCPDSDDDNIIDVKDECPTVVGLAIDNGCPPKDIDGDKIIDREDRCPTVSGPREEGGCPPPDKDNDGVPDSADRCPTVSGSRNLGGCPDADGDGIEDSKDTCPKVYGTNSKGCPTREEIAVLRTTKANAAAQSQPKSYEELTSIIKKSAKRIKFNTNSDVLTKTSFVDLGKISTILKANPKYGLVISGHTDNVGNEAKNQILSEKRAKRCYEFFTTKGIAKNRLQYSGYGSSMPIMDNNTPAGRNENRRVELELQER